MEKTDFNKQILLGLIVLGCFIQEGTAYSTSPTSSSSCVSSTANINYTFSLDGTESIIGTRIWFFGVNKIAESDGTTLTPVLSYSSRLTAYGTYGISLSNVLAADSGIYTYVIALLPSGNPFTATASLSVKVAPLAPPSGCSVNATQSRNNVTCTVNTGSGNCGTPLLNAHWVNYTTNSSQFECTMGGTYQCCATSDSLTCYSGSPNDFCILYNCTSVATTRAATTITTLDALCQPDGPLFIILDIDIIIPFTIMVILIINLIFWIKNLTFPVFKPFEKRGHRCILYRVLLLIVVFCEIGIIIMIIIGRQCQAILGVGLGLGLFIIIVTCIFLIFFIKTEIIIRHKDTIQNPRTNTDVKITASVRHIFISDVEWIGPKGNVLTTVGKYIIAQYSSDTGETSLTITNVSQDENGSYICQSKNGCKIAKDSIHILCDKETRSKNTGPPAFYIGNQNKVGPMTTSKQINERPQLFPPVGGVVEDKLKHRPQPPPPENIYAKNLNLQELPPNCEDAQGLPTGTPPSNRLTPITPKQATVQETDASEGTKKKRKKKKKKGKMDEEKQEEGM